MAGWILRIILFYIVVRALGRLLNGVVQGMKTPAAEDPASKQAVNLVRDPICGTFVVPSRALTSGTGSDTRFFCSERCRREWAGR